MISNFLKREITDSKVTVIPPKKNKKLPRGRSRKRKRAICVRDNSGPNIKSARMIETQLNSPKIETIDKSIDLQIVSEYIFMLVILYKYCF